MTQPGIEPRSPGPLANSLPIGPMTIYKCMQFSSKPKFGPERCPVFIRIIQNRHAPMQLLEQIKRSVIHRLNSEKLRIAFKSNDLLPPNLKKSMICFPKSFLIYKFLCRFDVCYSGCTTQVLDMRINRHIPSHISTNTVNYSGVLSHQNPPSAIARHSLDSPVCAAIYNPTYELHLSILEAYLILKHQLEQSTQKQFNTLLLFDNSFGLRETNKINRANSDGSRYFIYFYIFPSNFLDSQSKILIPHILNPVSCLQFSEETSSSSSSCRATSTDIPDPLSPLLPIIHRLRQVFRFTSCVLT